MASTEPTAAQIVGAFRAAGLTVVEMPGWAGRCRCHTGDHQLRQGPTGRGWETPRGITIHHTAGAMLSGQAAIDYTNRILVAGNGTAPGPLCLAGIDADGRIIMVGAGRANHIGSISTKAAGATKTGTWPMTGYTDWRGHGVDGNSFTYGFEILAPMTPNQAQQDAAVTASAVLCRLLGVGAGSVHGHGEASDQRSYVDPNLDMGAFRRRVAAALTPKPTIPTGITAPASTGDLIMALTSQEKSDFVALLRDPDVKAALSVAALSATYGDHSGDGKGDTAGQIIGLTAGKLDRLQAELAAVKAAVVGLSGGTVTQEMLDEAVSKGLASIDVTVTAKAGA